MAATTDDIQRHGLTVPRKKKFNDSAETYLIAVVGDGTFPIDMLRYDRCWPASQDDVSKIGTRAGRSALMGGEEQRRVYLRSYDLPTIDRWQSFGWRVVELA